MPSPLPRTCHHHHHTDLHCQSSTWYTIMEHISNLILVKWKVSKWVLNVLNRQTDEKVIFFHHLHVKVNIISSTDREMQKVLIFHDSLTPPIIRQMQNVIIFRHSQISEDNLCQTDRLIQKVFYRKKQWFFLLHTNIGRTHQHYYI